MLLFGHEFKSNTNVINCILLCARYVIYGAKFKNEISKFADLLCFMKSLVNTEKLIAIKNNRLPKHTKKWLYFCLSVSSYQCVWLCA